MMQRNIGDFECLFYKSSLPKSLGNIIMFHGYGADAENLAPIRYILDPLERYHWYLPNGAFKIPLGPSLEGRAWFPLNMMELQMAYIARKFDYFENSKPYGLFETLHRLNHFFELVQNENESPQLHIGGFSQGSMLATFAALGPKLFPHVKNLFLFSSTLVAMAELKLKFKDLPSDANFQIFQSHGTVDPVLPFSQAVRLGEILKSCFKNYHFEGFRGGHEIPEFILQKARLHLEQSYV